MRFDVCSVSPLVISVNRNNVIIDRNVYFVYIFITKVDVMKLITTIVTIHYSTLVVAF